MTDPQRPDENSIQQLSPEERARKLDLAITSQYACLGEFVAKFEFTVFSIRQLLMWVVHSHGAPQALINPAYAELTAGPLRSVMLSTCSKAIELRADYDETERGIAHGILRSICARFATLTEQRNEIVHGTWFIGWASPDQTDFGMASGYKPKNTKEGVLHTDISREVADFDVLIDECNYLSEMISRMSHTLTFGMYFSKNFQWDGKNVTIEEEYRSFKRRPRASK